MPPGDTAIEPEPPDVLSLRRLRQGRVNRASALAALAPHLGEELLGEALTAARAINDESHQTWVLGDLVPHLGEELLGEALTAARAIDDEALRAWTLGASAPSLGGNPETSSSRRWHQHGRLSTTRPGSRYWSTWRPGLKRSRTESLSMKSEAKSPSGRGLPGFERFERDVVCERFELLDEGRRPTPRERCRRLVRCDV